MFVDKKENHNVGKYTVKHNHTQLTNGFKTSWLVNCQSRTRVQYHGTELHFMFLFLLVCLFASILLNISNNNLNKGIENILTINSCTSQKG